MTTVKDYLSKTSASRRKQAEPFVNSVREFEKDPSGKYVAFVDDGPHSYDVQLDVDNSGNLVSATCDCEEKGSSCNHILACLITFDRSVNMGVVAKSATSATKKIVRKKKTPAHIAFVQEVDTEKVILWLAEELKSNKALKVKFKNDLILSDERFAPDQLQKNVDDIIKSIKGRKRSIAVKDCGEIIKIIKPIFLKVMDSQLPGTLHLESSRDLMDVILSSIGKLYRLTEKKSKRLETFDALIMQKYCHLISMVKATETQLAFYFHLPKEGREHISFIDQVNLLCSFTHLDRVELIALLREWISGFSRYDYAYQSGFLSAFVDVLERKELLQDLLIDLPMVLYANEYNLKVLSLKYEEEMYDEVIADCKVIYKNYSFYYAQQYDGIYYKALMHADFDTHKETLIDNFLGRPSFDLFELLRAHLKGDALSDFYDKVLSCSKCSYGYVGFMFRLEVLMIKERYDRVFKYMSKYPIADALHPKHLELLAEKDPLKVALNIAKCEMGYEVVDYVEATLLHICEHLLTLKELHRVCSRMRIYTTLGQQVDAIYQKRLSQEQG